MRIPVWMAMAAVGLVLASCSDSGSSGDAGAPDAATGAYFPCDVEAVLKAKCHTCHTNPPRNVTLVAPLAGEVVMAPFSLMEYAHTQRDYGGGLKIYQVMKNAIEANFMPLSGSPTGPLTPEQKTTMLTWLTAGAPPAPQPCSAQRAWTRQVDRDGRARSYGGFSRRVTAWPRG
jgi:hypothetical protein